MKIQKMCPSCRNQYEIEVDDASIRALENGAMVHNALGKYDLFTRECFISGLCFDCQSKVFNRPKPGESWGEQHECPNCECSVWDKNFREDKGNYRCPSCGFVFTKEQAENPNLIDWDALYPDDDDESEEEEY